MLRHLKSVILTIIILAIAFLSTLMINRIINEKKQINDTLEQEMIMIEKQSYLDRLAEQEENHVMKDKIKTTDFYQKIEEEINPSILIIGNIEQRDFKLNTSQVNWVNNFNSDYTENFKGRIKFEFIDLFGSSVISAWSKYRSIKNLPNHDLIILDCLVNSENQLTIDEFCLYYDAIIREILSQKNNIEIYSLVDNEKIKNKQYFTEFEKINKIYNIDALDTSKLSTDKISELLIKTININTKIVDRLPEIKDASLKNIASVSNIESLTPVSLSYITRYDDYYYTETNNSMIEYITDKSNIAFSYYTDKNGGLIKVYINDELYKEISTYNDNFMIKSVVLASQLGEKRIKMVMETDLSKEEFIIFYDVLGSW